jgi:hypothetical protein
MHLLSVFPQILFLAPLTAFMFRITLAILLIYSAWPHYAARSMQRILALIEIILAAALAFGVGTQITALVAFVLFVFLLFYPSAHTYPRSTIILAAIIALSLVVTGAGLFAIDLPL